MSVNHKNFVIKNGLEVTNGQVGIGTNSPSDKLHVVGDIRVEDSDPTIKLIDSDGTLQNSHIHQQQANLYFDLRNNTGDGTLIVRGMGGGSGTEKLRITSDGKLLIGSDTIRNVSGANSTSQLQIEGTSTNTSSLSLINNQNSGNSANIRFGKTRGTSTGAVTTVADGDKLGAISFNGADGTDLENDTAKIEAIVNGTVSGNTVPTDITFLTSATNGNSKEERLRITSAGNVGIGTDNPSGELHIYQPTGQATTLKIEGGSPELWFKDVDETPIFRQIINANGWNVQPGTGSVTSPTWGSVALTVDESGNVGIGATNPSDKLQVNGSIKISAAAPIIKLAETGVTGNPSWWIVQDGGNFSLRNNNTAPYAFQVATKGANKDTTDFVRFGGDTIVDALTLTAHGTNPTYLDLKGNNANARMRYFEGATERWNIGYDAGIDSFTFYDTQNSTSRVVLKDGGKVGIGTNSPERELDIKGNLLVGPQNTTDLYQGQSLRNGKDSSVANTISFIDFQNNLGVADCHIFAYHKTNGGSTLRFGTTNAGDRTTNRRSTALVIDEGNVGIGTTNPSGLFEVEGNNSPDPVHITRGGTVSSDQVGIKFEATTTRYFGMSGGDPYWHSSSNLSLGENLFQVVKDIALGSSDNLNSLTDGYYTWVNNQPTNFPGNSYMAMLQLSDNNQKIQMAFGSSSSGRLYVRRADSGTFYTWTEFARINESSNFTTTPQINGNDILSTATGLSANPSGPIYWSSNSLTTFDPPGGGTGTDTATDVVLGLASGNRIAGWHNGYIRTLLEWNDGSDITIGQGSTTIISGINLIPGSAGLAKVNGEEILTKNSVGEVNNIIHTSDGEHDITLFGAAGGAAQSGAFNSKLIIKGGSSQTRTLELFQDASGYATINTSYSSNYLDFTGFNRLRLNQQLDLNGNNIIEVEDIGLRHRVYHDGDSNTYFEFHANDSWRVVTGNVERLEVNNTQTTINQNATIVGSTTITKDGDALNLRSTTNAAAVRVTFSSDVPDDQIGHIEYIHTDTAAYGSNEAFILGGTETDITVLADGKLMYTTGIYSKPATGTGAGTRKDANWDTAYGWGNHGSAGYATETYVGTQISNLVNSAPSTLDTLNELAAALGDDANFSTTITNSIATKLSLAGGQMTGDIDLNGNKLIEVEDIILRDRIHHDGDTNTYMQFHANDQWRVVTGNIERLEVNNTQTTINQNATVNGAITIGGSSVSTTEGGEIRLTKPTNQTTGDTYIDLNSANLRFFHSTSPNKGAYINLSNCADAVGSRILTTSDEGSGNGLDADTLDGQEGSYYQNATNLTSGTIPDARITDIGNSQARIITFDNLEKSDLTADGQLSFDSSQGLLVYRAQQGVTEAVTVWDGANVSAGTGISITNLDGGDTGTGQHSISLANHSAALLTSGTIDDARIPDSITPLTRVTTAEVLGSSSNLTISATGSGKDLYLKGADNVIIEPGREEDGAIYFRGNSGGDSYRFAKSGQTAIEGFLSMQSLTADRTFTFPDVGGTIALTTSAVSRATTASRLSPLSDGSSTVSAQGMYTQWNRASGTGSSYFINQKGSGGGGWRFLSTTTSNVDTAVLLIEEDGRVTIQGSDKTVVADTFTGTASGNLPLTGGTLTGDLTIPSKILHAGDTDTYIQFDAANKFRVVCQGGEVQEWGNNYTLISDNDTLRLGTGSDFQMKFNGADTVFKNHAHANGDIIFQGENSAGTSQNILIMKTDGTRTYNVLYENSAERFRTNSTGVKVTGVMDSTSSVNIGGELNLIGTSDSNKNIDCRVGSNALSIRKTTGGDAGHETMARFVGDGAVELYHNNVKKFETTSTGASVVGGLTTTGAVTIAADNQETGALRILANQTNPAHDDYYFAQEIESTLSGSNTFTGDYHQGGLWIDVNSSATGGSTSHEHRAYGIFVDLDVTGDADVAYAIFADSTVTPTTGTVTNVTGVYGRAEDNGGAGSVSSVIGVRGEAVSDNSNSDINNMYGGYFRSTNAADTGQIAATHGCYGEIEVVNNTGDKFDKMYVFRAEFDDNDTSNDSSPITATSYLYYGNYAGTNPTTAFGVHIADNVKNYFGGDIGIGTDTPGSKLHTKGTRDYTGSTPSTSSYDNNFQSGTAVLAIGQSNGIPAIQGFGTGTAYHLVLAPNNGNVGIGTSGTPNAKLDVNGNIHGTKLAVGTASNPGANLDICLGADNDTGFSCPADGELKIWSNNTEVALFKHNGIVFTDQLTTNGRLNVRGHLDLSDGENLDFGSSDDVRITYNSNNWLYCDFRTGNGIAFRDNGVDTTILEDSGIFRPQVSGTGSIGTSTRYWGNGYFQDFNVSGTINVRGAVDLADNDILRLGSGDDAELFCNGSHLYLDLNSGIGNFYIRDGTTTRYTFNDNGNFTATGNVTAYSDIKLKANIEPIANPLDKVNQINGVTFDRIDTPELGRQMGVIAQDVEKVCPELVSTDDEGIKSVSYGNMVGLLIEAIKDQQKQIDELKAKLENN